MSSFITAHERILGYSLPKNGVKDVINERKYYVMNKEFVA